MITKVIFLDVDGVVCTRRSHLSYGKEGAIWSAWDPLACNAILRCMPDYASSIRLVISSTWRKDMHKPALMGKLNEFGLLPHLHDDWRTKELKGIRGHEIAEWLSRHPEVTSYRILDDNSDFLDSQEKFLIKTDPDEGMQSIHIKKLLNWAGVLKA